MMIVLTALGEQKISKSLFRQILWSTWQCEVFGLHVQQKPVALKKILASTLIFTECNHFFIPKYCIERKLNDALFCVGLSPISHYKFRDFCSCRSEWFVACIKKCFQSTSAS